jgi:glycosyltransferase involved in cell wall biosynthesis
VQRVLFFIHDGWVFGKIHHELVKLLYPQYACDVLCWTRRYSDQDMQHISQKYDLFVSTPDGCTTLHNYYNIPHCQMIAVVHQDYDIYSTLEHTNFRLTIPEFDLLAGYAVICPLLVNISFSYGISRIPTVLPIGVFSDMYEREPSTTVNRIGYFSSFCRKDRGELDIKRGYLAHRVAEQSGVELVTQESTHFLAADRLYRDVDLVLFCSLIEGNPYPALEAFASGLPVLGTNVGRFADLSSSGGGFILPFEDDLFVAAAVDRIKLLQNNAELYSQMSAAAKQKSVEFDWYTLKEQWLQFLNDCWHRRQQMT